MPAMNTLYLVDAFELKPALKWPLAALYVAVLLTAIIVFLVAVFRPQRSSFARYRPSLAALLAIFPIAALIFSLTKFGQEGSTRYLLPLYPPLAIFAGLATALLARRVQPFPEADGLWRTTIDALYIVWMTFDLGT